MLAQFITKYQTGGLINVDAMRNDMRRDEQYYKNGVYTTAGRRNLAAIAEIEANQSDGKTYVVDDESKSFKIIDQQGNEIHDGTGRGVGTKEFVGPIYGTLGNKRISKRNVSELMSQVNSYRIQPQTNLVTKEASVEELVPEEESGEESAMRIPAKPAMREGEKAFKPHTAQEYADYYTGGMMPKAGNAGLSGPNRPDVFGGNSNGSVSGGTPQSNNGNTNIVPTKTGVSLPSTWADYGTLLEQNVNGLMRTSHNPSVGNAGGFKSMVTGGDKVYAEKIAKLEEAVRLKKQKLPITTDIVVGVPGKGKTVIEKQASQASLEELQASLVAAQKEYWGLYRTQAEKSSMAATQYLNSEIERLKKVTWSNTAEKNAVLGYLQYYQDQISSKFNAVVTKPNAENFVNLYGGIDNLPGYNQPLYWVKGKGISKNPNGDSLPSGKQYEPKTYVTTEVNVNQVYDDIPIPVKSEGMPATQIELIKQPQAQTYSFPNSSISQQKNLLNVKFKKGGKMIKTGKYQFGGTINWGNLMQTINSVNKFTNPSNTLVDNGTQVNGIEPTSLVWSNGSVPVNPNSTPTYNVTQPTDLYVGPQTILLPKQAPINNSSTGDYIDYRGSNPEENAKNKEIADKNAIAEKSSQDNPTLGTNYPEEPNDQQVLNKELYRDNGGVDKKTNRYGPVLSTTGVNVGNMEIQYGDMANLFFALKARNQKLAEIPVFQEKFTPAGSRYVRAAEDMNAEMIHKAENEIAQRRSQYKGSDPIMDLISGHMAREQRGAATQALIEKRAAIRMAERDRVDESMEQKRQQESADNLRLTDTENRNTERRMQGKTLTAQEKVRKESAWWANANSIIQNIQTRNNAQSSVNQQYESGLRVLEHQNKVSAIRNQVSALTKQKGMLEVRAYDATSPEQAQAYEEAINKIDEQLATYAENMRSLSDDINAGRAEAAELQRGKGLFRIFENGGKLVSH